jgi:hypothetical protein
MKHISVIAWLSAAGGSLVHYILTSSNAPTVQEHLKKQSVCFDRDFALKITQKPYLEAGIILDDIRTVLLPYLTGLRGLAVLVQDIAVLVMDHCSAHVSDDVIRILT